MNDEEKHSLDDLIKRIQNLEENLINQQDKFNILEANQQKSFGHRMNYLTWTLSNPLAIIVISTMIAIIVELIINNWGNSGKDISLNSLTQGINWTIPIVISVIGLYSAFTNKIYLLIQEQGDMNLISRLRAEINGMNHRIEREQKKRDEEKAREEKEYKAEQLRKEELIREEQLRKEKEYKAEQLRKEELIREEQLRKEQEYKAEQLRKEELIREEQLRKEQEYKVEQEKRDLEIKSLIKELQDLKISHAKLKIKFK